MGQVTKSPFQSLIDDFVNKWTERYLNANPETPESDHALVQEMVRSSSGFFGSHGWLLSPKWLAQYKQAAELLEARVNRPNPTPQPGDSVKIRCENGKEYNCYLDTEIYGELGHITTVRGASVHIHRVEQAKNEGISASVSGGPFINVGLEKFKSEPVGTMERTFWFWGDRPQGNGGLYITRPMLLWELTGIEPQFY